MQLLLPELSLLLVVIVLIRVLLVGVLEGAAMVGVGEPGYVDVGELEDGGELLEAGNILHVQLLDVDQAVRR